MKEGGGVCAGIEGLRLRSLSIMQLVCRAASKLKTKLNKA